MTKTTHTEAPWTLQELETARNGYQDWRTFAIRSPANVCLAVVGDVDRYESERIPANARLMAAAPNMLAALRRAAPWLGKLIADKGHENSVLPNDAVRTLEMVEAAIELATKP